MSIFDKKETSNSSHNYYVGKTDTSYEKTTNRITGNTNSRTTSNTTPDGQGIVSLLAMLGAGVAAFLMGSYPKFRENVS